MSKKFGKRVSLLTAALMAGALFSVPAFAVEPSAYTLTEVVETGNWNYYDIVNGTKTYYQITPKSGTHYGISTSGTTDFSIKSIKPGAASYSYHVTPQGTSADRVGDFNSTIGSEVAPVVFRNISTNPVHPDKGGAVYNYNNEAGHSIYADFVSNTTTNYGGGVRNGYHSSPIINKIVGNFVNNSAGGVGGAIANAPDCDPALGENPRINEIIANFIGNKANNGGAIYNERIIGTITGDFLSNTSNDKGGAISNINIGTIGNTTDSTSGILGNFVSNSSINGGAIYNEGTISNIEGDFILNTATTNGGAINNNGAAAKITNITGNFSHNSAGSGGAIYNFGSGGSNGEISNIAGDFESNSATGNGGAISNFGGLAKIGNIAGNFKGNHADGSSNSNGGAIYNGGTIGNSDGTGGITGDFENNSATKWGGAIVNGKTINKVTGNFTKNSATSGGVVYNSGTINFVAENDKNITFSGNYVTDESGKGGAIFNTNSASSIVGLYAGEGHSITFVGGDDDTVNNKYDIDGIYNQSTLNINGDGTITPYTGTVNLYNVTDAATARGITNIYGGTVNVASGFIQKDLNLNAGTLNLGKGGTVTNLNANGGALSMSIPDGTFENYENETSTLTVDNFTGTLSNFTVDYDAETKEMDKINITGTGSSGIINLTAINVIGTSEDINANATYLEATGSGNIGDIDVRPEGDTIKTVADDYLYEFTFADKTTNKGKVGVTKSSEKVTLPQIIQTDGINAYSAQRTVTLNADLGALAGENRNFTIFGNGNTIDGTNPAGGNFDGVTVGDYANQVLNVENVTMQNFTTAITNEVGATTNINGVTFTNNTTDIDNDGTLNLSGANSIDTIINNGTTNMNGTNTIGSITGVGATEITAGTTTINDSISQKDLILDAGSSLIVDAAGLQIANGITNNGNISLGNGELNSDITGSGNIAIDGSVVNNAIIETSKLDVDASGGFTNDNEVTAKTIANAGNFVNNGTTIAENSFDNTGNIINNESIAAQVINKTGKFTANEGSVVQGKLTGGEFNANGTNTFVGTLRPRDLNINNGMLNMIGELSAKNTNANGGALNMVNGGYETANLGNLTLNQNMPLILDTNIITGSIDKISADSVSGAGKINMVLNVPSRIDTILTNPNITINPIANDFGTAERSALSSAIVHQSQKVTTPIFNYQTNYNPLTGMMSVATQSGGSGNYADVNPAVMATPVAAQMGGYLNLINSYDDAFVNMDMTMLMTKAERTAMKMRNKYAAADEANLGTFNPNQLPEENAGVWFSPYASFEKVNLNNGPAVGNNSYGGLVGFDSKLFELKNGWDAVYTIYAGYNGSHQHYEGNSIWQNGGQLGGTAVFYKNNFFTGLTATVGASVAEATTMFGREDSTMLMAGVANKTGYNWELLDGRFIVQPSMLLSYSFINTFDYNNAAGVKITSSPLNAIQIAPGLKFIGNLPHGWQPYLGVQMVWNIMDKSKYWANDVNLPETSIDPYIQYGVGLQKRWGERFTGFAQVMLRNGGRTGISLSGGFRWALGKAPQKMDKSAGVQKSEERNISLSVK